MADGDEQIRVRPAVVDDNAALLAIDNTEWTQGSGFPSVIEQERTTYFTIDTPPGDHLVAEYRGEVVGYVRLKPKTPLREGVHVFGIFGLVVTRRARRLGVASALLEAAAQEARARGGRKLSLHVLGSNPAALRLYERNGFVTEGHFREEFLIEGEYVDDITVTRWLK
ncbi:GNAT family N-acetyltransferase [Actinopolymorpha pittospori]|uniref:Ribosomal protein S18 acetylase RimI-like enzyme n=1 Tax=Actinopolymorpha pittospori TaxID=648752 RepID=A0A927MR73_9ACTN|nr:GNAT family N-acetyltransferase [Actinopolymorpha pittospori]MBE1605390.1 ribosomal protein S18 acetylase RimI-like enzyme [Actinopolymorpha pittospori]